MLRSPSLLLLAALLSFSANSADAPTPAVAASLALDYFVGSWHCDGVFPASGKTITSTMRFEQDAAIGALLKHHDDTRPALYHALETWSGKASAKPFNAAIVDNFGGVRTFTTPGWQNDTLTWSGVVADQTQQQFVYTKLDHQRFRIDWRVAKKDQAFVVGDTLTCVRDRERD